MLVVDDSSVVRTVVERSLRDASVEPVDEVLQAADGSEALTRIADGPVDVILSDVNMPNVDGIEFLRRLRGSRHKGVPVVMITTEGDEGTVLEAISLGAKAFIRKPFTPEQVSTALKRALSPRVPGVRSATPVAAEELSQIVERSVLRVFKIAVPVPVRFVGWDSFDDLPSFDGVVAMVTTMGNWVCANLCHCDDELACLVGAKMLMDEVASVDAQALDGIGELTNMIVGRMKGELESGMGPLELGIPAVVFGKNFLARPSTYAGWVETRFDCDGRRMSIWFSVEPNQCRVTEGDRARGA